MSEGEDGASKEHEPTQRKLDEARRKGELPRSSDLTAAASYAGLVFFAIAFGAASLGRMGETGLVLLGQADRLAPVFLSEGSALAGGFMSRIAITLLPWFVIPAATVALMLFGLRGIVFAPGKLAPKLSRISPIANAKNKFGRTGLFEFAKSLTKLLVISLLLWLFLLARLPRIVATIHLAPGPISVELLQLVVQFLALVVAILLVIGAIDFLWQRNEHFRRQRMTQKEMRDEVKQSEGNPHMKQQRRQRGYEIATNRMLAEIPGADVVIVNPLHYAIALKWDPLGGGAPVCVAKGVDEVALRIRERAAEAGIPIRRDPPTARALHATVALGEEVRPEHYRAVAAAIRFAQGLRRKGPRR